MVEKQKHYQLKLKILKYLGKLNVRTIKILMEGVKRRIDKIRRNYFI